MLKNRTLIIASLFLLPALVLASELKGKISTDPKAPGGVIATSTQPKPPVPDPVKPEASPKSGKDVPPALLAQRNNPALGALPATSKNQDIRVKGVSALANNALVRDSLKRIYVVKNGAKKHLKTLAEIKKFGKTKILDLPDSDLAEYPTRVWLDGELLRARGQADIFAVENGRKKRVSSLEELRKKYAGVEILNVEAGEMEKYLK